MNRLLLLKVASWRLTSVPITLLVTYLYSGKLSGSVELTVLLTVVLTTCQFAYEKLWIRYLEGRVKRFIGAYKSAP